MKTKNFLLTGALLIVALFSVNGVMAEGPSNYANSGTTTVNINLSAIQAILVNDDQVNLNYTTLDDYNQGVEITKANHLTVYSVGGFVVKVKSNGNFIGENGFIDASDVKITATAAEGSPDTFSEVELSTDATALITSSTGGFEKNYDVKYSTKNNNGNAFQYAKHLGGTYTAVVTYDIAQN
jgi:hypothetical protein